MWPLGGEWGVLNEWSVVKWGKAPCREEKSGVFCLSLEFHWTFSIWSKFTGFATELCHLLMISGRGWQGLKQKHRPMLEMMGRAQLQPLAAQRPQWCRFFQMGWHFRKSGIQPFVPSKPNAVFRPGICLEPPRMGIPEFPLAPIPLLIHSRGEFYFLLSHQILWEQPRLRHQFPQPLSQPWLCKTSLEAERRSHPCPRDWLGTMNSWYASSLIAS